MTDTEYNLPPQAQKQLIDVSEIYNNSIKFFKTRWLYFFIGTILSIVGGFVKYQIEDKIYSSKLTAETFSLGDTRVIDLMSVLQQYIDYGDFRAISKLLLLSENQSKLLTHVSAGTNYEIEKKVKGSQMYVDDQPKQVFFIEVKVKDTSVLNPLQEGLKYYISNTPLSKLRLKSLNNALEIYKSQIDRQIKRSDSLTDLLVANQLKGNGNDLSVNFGAVIEGTAKAAFDRFEMMKQYENAAEVNIIVPFAKYNKPESPRLLSSLLVYILPFNLLIFLILLAIESRKSK